MNINTIRDSMIKAAGLSKKADGGVANDTAGAAVSAAVPFVGPLTNLAGAVTGFIQGKPSKAELNKMDEHPGRSWLPGVGAYRLTRKNLDAIENDKARSTQLAEGVGMIASPLLLALAAGGIGAATGGIDGAAAGAAIGGLAGAGTQAVGSLIGLLRKRRTQREQEQADRNMSLLANLIPGVAGYRQARRLPSLTRKEDARNRAAELEADGNAGSVAEPKAPTATA